MSESLKTHYESGEKDISDGFRALLDMKDDFNYRKAEALANDVSEETESRLETIKQAVTQTPSSEQAPIKPESKKPVSELTPAEAAKEYLDTIYDLSQNFTGPEARTSRYTYQVPEKVYRHQKDRIKGFLVRFDKVSSIEEATEDHKHKNKYLDRALSLYAADDIIDAECMRRRVAQSYREIATKAGQIADDAAADMNPIEKAFNNKKTQAALQKLLTSTRDLREYEHELDDKMRKRLDWCYAPDGEWHYNRKIDDAAFDKYRQQFFSGERAAKIERAIELRNSLYERDRILDYLYAQEEHPKDQITITPEDEKALLSHLCLRMDLPVRMGNEALLAEIIRLGAQCEKEWQDYLANASMSNHRLKTAQKHYLDTDYEQSIERLNKKAHELIRKLYPTHFSGANYYPRANEDEHIRRKILHTPEVELLSYKDEYRGAYEAYQGYGDY